MTHKFDINTLSLQQPVEKSRLFYLLIKVSEKYCFRTAEQHMNNLNTIPFMETNEFEVPEDLMIYYSISLYEKLDNGSRLLQKKLLFKRDIKKEQMVFKLEGENTATLHFKAVVTKNAAVCSLGILENRIATSATELAEIQDASKLELLSMGGLTYRFVNRLDPLVYFKNYLREVVNWKNPLHTLFFGFFCTFFILNPRLALMIVAALIVWHKDTIFIKLENFSRHTKDRLVPPQQNLKLLQNMMTDFCDVVDHLKEMIFGEDKTEFIVLLNGVIAGAWVLMIIPIFVNFDTMLVLGLWFGLLVGLDISKIIFESLQNVSRKPIEFTKAKLKENGLMNKPFFREIRDYIDKLFPGVIQVQVKKTFYVYEYQRWWLGNWGEPYKHQNKWSDEKGVLNVLPRTSAPASYQWIGEWKISLNLEETDEEGFMYSSDLISNFHKQKRILDVLRRRKWIRLCQNTHYPVPDHIVAAKR